MKHLISLNGDKNKVAFVRGNDGDINISFDIPSKQVYWESVRIGVGNSGGQKVPGYVKDALIQVCEAMERWEQETEGYGDERDNPLFRQCLMPICEDVQDFKMCGYLCNRKRRCWKEAKEFYNNNQALIGLCEEYELAPIFSQRLADHCYYDFDSMQDCKECARKDKCWNEVIDSMKAEYEKMPSWNSQQ